MTAAAIAAPKRAAAPLWVAPRLLLAIAIAAVLTLAWAWKDWDNLQALRLPDNDDMARLAQIRDWIAGQGFNDLMQYRLGPPGGSSMHWSRIPDLVPGAMIAMLTPLTGTHAAEVTAVIAWPALLFVAYLLLVGRIAGRFDARAAIPALILAALAFPTMSLFVPGRIDHHALQIVLTLLLADAIVAPASVKSGAVAGLAAALSLAIGLEAAPEILAAMAALGIAWLTGSRDEDRRALGLAAALGGTTLLLLLFARPTVWPEQWCDGFTPASTRATLLLAAAWAVMGGAGRYLPAWKPRLGLATTVGAIVAALAWQSSSVCVAGPYGALDPFLQNVWMRNVGEARGLFAGQDSFGTSLAYGALTLGGAILAAILWLRDRRWQGLAIFLALSALAAIPAVRVTYIMAGFAAVPFAVAIARAERPVARIALWVLGAGVTWNLAATKLDALSAAPLVEAKAVQQACTAAGPLSVIAAQPAGTIIAPVDLGAYLTGLTPHHVVASVYHRNNAGNLAMYRFFLSAPERSEALANQWGIDYVAICPDNLHEDGLAPLRKGSLAALLQGEGEPPAWLEPIPTGGSARLYRVH